MLHLLIGCELTRDGFPSIVNEPPSLLQFVLNLPPEIITTAVNPTTVTPAKPAITARLCLRIITPIYVGYFRLAIARDCHTLFEGMPKHIRDKFEPFLI